MKQVPSLEKVKVHVHIEAVDGFVSDFDINTHTGRVKDKESLLVLEALLSESARLMSMYGDPDKAIEIITQVASHAKKWKEANGYE